MADVTSCKNALSGTGDDQIRTLLIAQGHFLRYFNKFSPLTFPKETYGRRKKIFFVFEYIGL